MCVLYCVFSNCRCESALGKNTAMTILTELEFRQTHWSTLCDLSWDMDVVKSCEYALDWIAFEVVCTSEVVPKVFFHFRRVFDLIFFELLSSSVVAKSFIFHFRNSFGNSKLSFFVTGFVRVLHRESPGPRHFAAWRFRSASAGKFHFLNLNIASHGFRKVSDNQNVVHWIC